MRYLATIFLMALFFLVSAQDEITMSPEMLPDDTAKVRILNNRCAEEIYRNPDLSATYGESAIRIATKIDDQAGLANAYINYGKVLYSLDNQDIASEYYFRALKVGEEIHDEEIIATAWNYVATSYISIGNYAKAREYLLKAIELNRKNKNNNLLAANYNNIGLVFNAIEDHATALEYYFMSLEINQQLGNSDWISNNYGNIGMTYRNMGNPKAVDYFYKRIELKTALKDIGGVASGYMMLGDYYVFVKDYPEAIANINTGLALALEDKSYSLASDGLKNLSLSYNSLGNYKEAYNAQVLYNAMLDSTNKNALSKMVVKLELQHHYEKQMRVESLKQLHQKQRNYIIGSGLVAILVILGLLFLNQREKVKRTQLEKELLEDKLDHKNRELTTNMLYLLRKNELIECISDKLIDLRKNLKKENQHVIQQVISDLRLNLDNNVWEEFEVRFQDVHGSFYDNLQHEFPDLTVGEKRLCAFLRMDMSSKEVSAITGQSVSSIEVARTRLRKKLGISNTQVGLSQFLSNY